MTMQEAIQAVLQTRDLSADEMQSVMQLIMTGEATQAQIGGFLIGLRMKGETVDEITAAARVMRELATQVEADSEYLVDTCGTGGDGAKTFNISTASAIVAAAAGARVAKHGNHSVSSSSGSADVLLAAGVKLDIAADVVAKCIREVGVGFLFAPKHHGAMKHAIGPRREMGVRTIFNVLGPLTNPASAPNQVLGVFAAELVQPLAEVLKNLGSRHVMVVHSDDGMDEISLAGPTQVSELKDGEIRSYRIEPADFGIANADVTQLSVDSAEQSLAVINSVFAGKFGAASDIVALNAGAAIYVSGLVDTMKAGVAKAREVLGNGAAAQTLQGLKKASHQASN